MSDPIKVLQEPHTRSWQQALSLGIVGLVFGLIIAFAVIFWHSQQVVPLADVFLSARAPLLQHRSEKGAWPQDFDLSSPPEALLAYAYGPVRSAVLKAGVSGRWRFESGASGAAVAFIPSEWSEEARRVLVSVDGRLDDGDPASGQFRVGADRATFTLKAD